MITIKKEDLFNITKEAVGELKNAFDKHNSNSEMVKIYINQEGELYHTIQKSNCTNQNHTEILSFEYSRPEYDTTQEMLDENSYDGTIEEWDWENFTYSDDMINYVERLVNEAIENSYGRNYEIIL